MGMIRYIRNLFKRRTIYQKRYEAIGKLVAIEIGRNRQFRRELSRLPLGERIIRIANGTDNGKG